MNWDIYLAEYADTRRSQFKARPLRPCVYCSAPTRALSGVCPAHDDLIDLDPGYPAVVDETDVTPRPDAPSPPPAPGLHRTPHTSVSSTTANEAA